MMTTAEYSAGVKTGQKTRKSQQGIFRRAGTAINKWWRRRWYRFGRGRTAKALVKVAAWHRPAVEGTFASTSQTPALIPLLTSTELRRHGHPLGVDLLTNQAVLEDVRDLYRAGMVNSPNECVIGAVGTAKSTYVKISLLRSIQGGGRGVVFDRKRQTQAGEARGEYYRLSSAVGGTTIRIHQDPAFGTRINILDPAIASVTAAGEDSVMGQDRLLIMVAEASIGSALTPEQRRALTVAHHAALTAAKQDGRIAVLSDVIQALQHPTQTDLVGVDTDRIREWGLPVVLGLLRYTDTGDLSGLIDGETSGPRGEDVNFNANLLVFDTSSLEFGSTALGVMMAVATAFLMSVWVNVPGPKSVVLEETYSADGVGVVPAMFRDLAKRTRGVGASMISVFHHLSDVQPGSPLQSLITESEVVCVFRQDKSADVNAVLELLGLDPSIRELVMTLPRGVHIRKRGAKLPVAIVEPVRTDLEREISFTDDAIQ